jgi:hypothetical protein
MASLRFDRFLIGTAVGAVVGVGGILVGFLRAWIASAGGVDIAFEGVWPKLAYYILAFAAGGGFVGLAWPQRASSRVSYRVFIAGMMVVGGGVIWMESGSPLTWSGFDLASWLVLSCIFGVAIGYGYNKVSL